jgi:hypothetical protein
VIQVKRKGKWVSATVTGVASGGAAGGAEPTLDVKTSSGTEIPFVAWAVAQVRRAAPVITKGKRPGGVVASAQGPAKRMRLAGAAGSAGERGASGEGELVEMKDEVDDAMLSRMLVKDILGVRMQGVELPCDGAAQVCICRLVWSNLLLRNS